MNAHSFKKKQEQNYQFCKCSLSSAGGTKEKKGEKFLVRLQTQSSKGNIQVNMLNKQASSRKEKESKQSLKQKEKKHESIYQIIDKGFSTSHREDPQVFPIISYNLPRVYDRYQTTIDPQRNRNQRNQYTFVDQTHSSQPPHQIRVERRLQNNYKEALTQRSTQCSNANQLISRIQVLPSKANDMYVVNNATVSVIQQKQIDQANSLPRSKSFSLNLKRKESVNDVFNYINQERQHVISNNQPVPQINQIQMMPSLKLDDLMFKSVESFHEGSSDQYSELASENDYYSNPNINQNTWCHSLNQIFFKKMRRMSHKTNS